MAQEVKVQVGLVCDDGDGRLKKVKGRTIPVLFDENDDAKTLLKKSVDKHLRHHKQFDKDEMYVILYQDMTLVKDLPGTNTQFTLGAYKRDLLMPYSKIYFWLCSTEDFKNCSCDSSKESENEDDIMMYSAFSSSDNRKTDRSVSKETTCVPTAPTTTISIRSNDSPSTHSHGIEKYLVPYQCPTCLSYFAYDEIESHADTCAENWIDTVGECTLVTNFSEEQNIENEILEESLSIDEMESIPERLEKMRRIVQALNGNVKNTSVNRLNIRRRCVFEDYMDARIKKYFKSQGLLKVCFTGEPAIDGGGPRREFFTGTLQCIIEPNSQYMS